MCLRLFLLSFPAFPLCLPLHSVIVDFEFQLCYSKFIRLVLLLQRVNQVVSQLVDIFKVLQLNFALLKQAFLLLQILKQLLVSIAQRGVAFLKSIELFMQLLQLFFLPCIVLLGEFIPEVFNGLVLLCNTITLGFDQATQVLGVLKQLLFALFPFTLLLPKQSQITSQLLVVLLQFNFVFLLCLQGFLKTLYLSQDFANESLQFLILYLFFFYFVIFLQGGHARRVLTLRLGVIQGEIVVLGFFLSDGCYFMFSLLRTEFFVCFGNCSPARPAHSGCAFFAVVASCCLKF